MRRSSLVYACLLTFTVVLALIIGWRLPAEARALVLGVLAGVAASIPTSLLVAWLAMRARTPRPPRRGTWPAEAPPRPRVVVDQTPASSGRQR
jgi:hypothetical protein